MIFLHCSTNNRKETVLSLFDNAVDDLNGFAPSRIRTDKGRIVVSFTGQTMARTHAFLDSPTLEVGPLKIDHCPCVRLQFFSETDHRIS